MVSPPCFASGGVPSERGLAGQRPFPLYAMFIPSLRSPGVSASLPSASCEGQETRRQPRGATTRCSVPAPSRGDESYDEGRSVIVRKSNSEKGLSLLMVGNIVEDISSRKTASGRRPRHQLRSDRRRMRHRSQAFSPASSAAAPCPPERNSLVAHHSTVFGWRIFEWRH